MDCVATPKQQVHMHNSNLADIKVSFGGVANNIARNLAYLKQEVKLLSVFSKDGYGRDFKKHMHTLQIDIDDCLVVDEPTSMYLALLDNQRDLLMAMVDSSLLSEIKAHHIQAFLERTTAADVVVFDTNLDTELIECIIKYNHGALVCDPISIEKAKKIKPYLSYLSVFKPNTQQASAISGIEIVDEKTLKAAGRYFRKQGVQQTIITLGDKGGLLVDNEAMYRYWHRDFPIVSAIGAGDASLASFIAFDGDYDKIKTIQHMVKSAYITCLSEDSVNPKVAQVANETMEALNITIKKEV